VRHATPVMFPVDFDDGEHVCRVHPINVQLVTDPVIMPTKEEHGVILVKKVAHMNPNYTFFVDFHFILYVKNIEHQTLVLFLLLTVYMYICIYIDKVNILKTANYK
jgi:hypothetical protein